MSRSESLRMRSASWTTESGGSPPSDRPRDMLPRVGWKRMPRPDAASISIAMRSSSRPPGNTYIWSLAIVQPVRRSSAHASRVLARMASGVMCAQTS